MEEVSREAEDTTSGKELGAEKGEEEPGLDQEARVDPSREDESGWSIGGQPPDLNALQEARIPCGCGRELCRHRARGVCNSGNCKFCPCCHLDRQRHDKARHQHKPAKDYFAREVGNWTLNELALLAGAASAAGGDESSCRQRGFELMENCDECTASVIFEALTHLFESQTEVCKLCWNLMEQLRAEEPHEDESHEGLRAKLVELLEAGAAWRLYVNPGPGHHIYPDRAAIVERLQKHTFVGRARPKLPDLWHQCDLRWPTRRDGTKLGARPSIPQVPWRGICNQLLWCISLVQLKHYWTRGIFPRDYPIRGLALNYDKKLQDIAWTLLRPSKAMASAGPPQWPQWQHSMYYL